MMKYKIIFVKRKWVTEKVVTASKVEIKDKIVEISTDMKKAGWSFKCVMEIK